MADDYSFDIVSEVDFQAIDDAVNTANREIGVRYDFRGSVSRLELDKRGGLVKLYSDDEGKLKSVVDVFHSRLAKRGVDLKALDYQKVQPGEKATVTQWAKIIQGLSQEKAKEIVAAIKSKKFKVTSSIQSDKIRVSSKSKNILQEVIQLVKSGNYGIPLQFTNYR